MRCIPNNVSGTSYDVVISNPGSQVTLDNTSSPSTITINTLSLAGAGTSLGVENGASLSVTGDTTSEATLNVDSAGSGGSTLHVGGNLTNAGYGNPSDHDYGMAVGYDYITSASTVTVAGTFVNTGSLAMYGGNAGAEALLNLSEAAPSTLTGTFFLLGNPGGAAVVYGSGGITQIGDGSTNGGSVTLWGPNAFMELSGATGSNSALTGLKTIATNGALELGFGANLSTQGNLTNSGTIQFGPYGNLSTLNVGGSFSNTGDLEFAMTPDVPGSVNVKGDAMNSGTINIYHPDSGALNAGDLTNTGTLNDSGPVAINGAVMNGDHGEINLTNDGGEATLSASSLINLGSLSVDASAVTISGAMTNRNDIGLVSDYYGAATLTANSVINTGELVSAGGGITISGNLTSGKGGEISQVAVEDYPGQTSASLTVGGNVKNSGLINLQSEVRPGDSASTAMTVVGDLSSSGDIEISGGGAVLSVTGETDNSGTISVSDNGGLTASKLTNTGSVEIGGSSFCTRCSGSLMANSFSNTGSVTVDASNFVGPEGGTGAGGSLTANNFQNAGTVDLDSGVGAGGVLTVAAGGTYTQTAGLTDVDGTLMAPTVDIAGGTLSGSGTIDGNVSNDATVSPGDPATLTIQGDYTQNAGDTLVIDIASATDFSMLDVSGEASLDGTVDFDFLDGYVPGANTDFAFLQAGSVAGDFSALGFMGINCPSCTFNLRTLSLDTGSTPPGAETPEPGTLVLFATGMLLGLAWLLRNRQWIVIRGS